MKSSIALFLSLCLCFACQSNSSSTQGGESTTTANYTKLSPAEFASKLAEKKGALVDVRTPEEFQAGHLDNAQHMNFYDDDFEQQLLQLDKEKPVFIYCKSGGRSGKTGNKLKKLGFSEIYDLKGGYNQWVRSTQ